MYLYADGRLFTGKAGLQVNYVRVHYSSVKQDILQSATLGPLTRSN